MLFSFYHAFSRFSQFKFSEKNILSFSPFPHSIPFVFSRQRLSRWHRKMIIGKRVLIENWYRISQRTDPITSNLKSKSRDKTNGPWMHLKTSRRSWRQMTNVTQVSDNSLQYDRIKASYLLDTCLQLLYLTM